jgi:hypothetical protein
MIRFRKWMILTHRYLGICLSLLFVVWFISGIAMIYAKGMPRLTPELRLDRLTPLNLAQVRLTASEAVAQAEVSPNPRRVVLLTIMDRPAYRFTSSGEVIVFADTGEVLEGVDAGAAVTIAGRFMGLPVTMLRHVTFLTEGDQWTIGERNQMPMHKILVDDAAHTELYVSEPLGEVAVQTTRGSRALAWIAAIPHWLYFAPLRLNDDLWRQVILWASGLGAISTLIGLILAIIQFSPSRPFRIKNLRLYIPYAGWMRWHYIAGVFFGVFALTWVFSGLLSMEPWDWASTGGLGSGMRQAFAGGPLDLSLFPAVDAAEWNRALHGSTIKEIEFLRIQGDPYYVVRSTENKPQLISANPLEIHNEPFTIESLLSRAKQANPGIPIVESQVLSSYDSYYYSRDAELPLPVLRIKFDDPDKTWFYIDPRMGQIMARFQRRARLERWVYHGLHSLDFSFWYFNRPLWDITVIVLSIGGAVLSILGLWLGFKRVQRSVNRTWD